MSASIVHFYCEFRTEMSEWSGDGEPYMSEYEGEILVGLDDDVDEFRLAGRARLFIVNPDAAEEDEEAPSLFELLDLRGETAAYLPLLHSTEPNRFSPAVCRILREDILASRAGSNRFSRTTCAGCGSQWVVKAAEIHSLTIPSFELSAPPFPDAP